MGLTDYISRNPPGTAKPINKYDEDFVIAQIDAFIKRINKAKKETAKIKKNGMRLTISHHQTKNQKSKVQEVTQKNIHANAVRFHNRSA